MSNPSNNYKDICAGFFTRLVAFLIDCLLFRLLWWLFSFSFGKSAVFFDYTLEDILYYSTRTLLFALFLSKNGATPGKSIMRLRVVADDGSPITFGKALYRESVGRYLSTILMHIGYLFILFHQEKKALHDIVSDTRVVFKNADTSVFAESSPEPEEDPVPSEPWFDDDDVSTPFALPTTENASEETVEATLTADETDTETPPEENDDTTTE